MPDVPNTPRARSGAARPPGMSLAPRPFAPSPVDPDAVLGVLLARLRVLAALTIEDAAAASGISATGIGSLEEGDGLLPFTDVRALARVYGWPLVAFAARYERALGRARRRALAGCHPGASDGR